MPIRNRLRPRPNRFIGGEIVPGLTTSFVQKPPPRQVSCIYGGDIRRSILELLVMRHRDVIQRRMPGFGHGGKSYDCSRG